MSSNGTRLMNIYGAKTLAKLIYFCGTLPIVGRICHDRRENNIIFRTNMLRIFSDIGAYCQPMSNRL